jgi:transcriptional regulator with PAS, ATPase and Fis domain
MLQSETIFNEGLLKAVFESMYDGVVIVDCEGHIEYMSENYCGFLGVRHEQVIEKHVTNVIENTRMHFVVKSGKEEIADLQYLRGNYVVANRIPIVRNSRIVGAIGTVIFRDLGEWKKMNSHIKSRLFEMDDRRKELNTANGAKYSLHDLIGSSAQLKELKKRVSKVANGDISVLIRGESGTGKELVAHSIHQLSERSSKPFVRVNCGSIPENLLESELFGYEEGAFTGARKGGKAGKFQIADGGTIFLDEIGDMPKHMQIKLLRVLQEKEIETIGSFHTQSVDVRVIAATSSQLEEMLENRSFRKDLFYRINAIQFIIPPLRERTEDIPSLCRYFFRKTTRRINKRVNAVDPSVLQLFEQYHWPGNIRELENVIEAAVYLCEGEVINKESLPDYLKKANEKRPQSKLKEIIEETEKEAIKDALRKARFDIAKAADLLNIGKSSMYEKIKKYGISGD